MGKYQNIHIIGTSHISKESIEKVKKAVFKLKPKIIALELDRARFESLNSKKKQRTNYQKSIKLLGLKGFILNMILAFIEKSLGKYTGIKPGSEMKTAINLAKKLNIQIELIDQPIQYTMKKLTTEITRKEKLFFIKELIFNVFNKQNEEFNIKKIPSKNVINKLINDTKANYPTVYKILVQERNVYMANKLSILAKLYPESKILAIVGAGHEKDIVGELKLIIN